MDQFTPLELLTEVIVLGTLLVAWLNYRGQVRERVVADQEAKVALVKWRAEIEARLTAAEKETTRLDQRDGRIFTALDDIRKEISGLSERILIARGER